MFPAPVPVPIVLRQHSDDWSTSYFTPRSYSNEPLDGPNGRPSSTERNSRRTFSRNNISEEDFEIQYGEGPIPAPQNPRDQHPRRARQASRTSNASSRTRSLLDEDSISNSDVKGISGVNEGLETDGKRAEELEEAGLSWTVTLPSDNEQSRPYTNLAEANSVWKAEKTCDRRIGTTTLQSIHSIQYSMGERGLPKVTLFCPQGPTRHDEDVSLVQARWLDIQRVAILLLEAIKETFLRQSEHGAYVEPGSAMRFVGHRHQLHDPQSIIVTDPVIFVAFPVVELDSSRNHPRSGEIDEYHPRTLLQNLYGFDVLTSRGKHQVIHKMSVGSQSSDTLYVNQLWCLLIGSDILITMSGRPTDKLLSGTIEKRTDFFRQPLRIEIVDLYRSRYSMSISIKTTWVDFFRHVMFTIHGNLTRIMDYELVDEANEIVTAERWVDIAKSTRSGLLRFHLVERKAATSRTSSVSSRRSSRTGIRKLLMLDQAHRDKSRDSSRRGNSVRGSYYEDSSSSESSVGLGKSSKPVWPGLERHQTSLFDTATFKKPVKKKERRDGKESEQYPHAFIPGHGYQSGPSVITLDSSDEKESSAVSYPRHSNAFPAPVLQQSPPSDAMEHDNDHEKPLTSDDHRLNDDQQLAEDNAGEAEAIDERASATQLEEGSSSSHDENEQGSWGVPNRKPVHPLPIKDSKSLDQRCGVQIVVDDSTESNSRSASQSAKQTPPYRKVTIEDVSEAEESDADTRAKDGPDDDDSLLYEFVEADFDESEVLEKRFVIADRSRSHSRQTRANTPQKGDPFRYHYNIRQNSPYRRSRSRSRSSSTSTDESFQPRGRSPTPRRRRRGRDDTRSSRNSSSWRGVRFDARSQHSRGRDSLEMSPYGSSNATKVEGSTVRAVAMPFFCWRQSGVLGAISSPEITDQSVIKLLDQIDDLICDDPIGKYYSKVAEFTMDDIVLRHECLHEAILGRNWIMKPVEVEVNDAPRTNTEAIREHLTPSRDQARNSTSSSLGRGAPENTEFHQTQALGLASHDKTLMKQLVKLSQQIVWSFIPNTGGSEIHTLMKRFWGCVDAICLQLLWEENQRGHDAEPTYIIRNFSSQVKDGNPQRRKPSLSKTHYLECEDCKAAKPYASAESALEHIHEKHIECLHGELGRPYDDPCYAWLHRIWHDGYPLRSSQDGLLGIVEDFIEELSDISMYVRELLNMTARDSSTGDTPPLSVNMIHIFQQIVRIFVFRSKQLSLINRRRSLAAEGPQENLRLIQRIDRKIEELLSLEIDANERIIDLSESAKKDIFMSGIGSHSEMPQAETVRVQVLALAFMSAIQRPLLQSSHIGRSYAKDTLLQLYREYTSRLHFQANNRPRKRVFLDIHGLEEELQALDKLLGSQESCLYNVLTLIDPLTSRYTTETRIREFRAELQYGNNMLRGIIDRRREIEHLATRLRILKDQVKQTIEIMEEDHGKAIRVFTVVTLFFLPLSFVSSFLGMNTVDVRDTEYSQRIFWMTGVPVTVAVLSVAFVYGYKGEEILDWMGHVLQQRRRRNPTWGENRDAGYRTSLETGWREWNLATATNQPTVHRRRLTTLMRRKISDPAEDIENLKMDDSDGKVWIERRNTDDSLAPIRRRM
ncbi:hypothetical protein BBK36DRAFT_1202489 [Trichoderma citrinoviride]|uniref:Cora-domain-containing protein n=1 Tax=Trichoderma citrinoviride TaxID=58853 RepID=A0A2T4B8R1_9HYPO|nr:hypothetical protein BBK36DRAFT_1202489 [Trichoderma citrinoviride]PTB65716.1 hypothetical protein BBK36DRAFT_1202489 [Trichoderma citrinoviride]